jgi:hypothetical protein
MQTAIHRWYDGTEDDAAWGDADPKLLMEAVCFHAEASQLAV